MSIENKINATVKNIEGKAQETLGEITGDPAQKAEGQVKQVEAAVSQAAENIKDKAKDLLDSIKSKLD
jgi:uncharacterized protein YjbJ (UPF0337 family)